MEIIVFALIGALGGTLGGMGMGGGSALIPMLTLIMGVEQKTAQLINLASFIPVAVVSLINHFKNKFVSVKTAVPIIIPALFCSTLTSLFVKNFDGRFLKTSFGLFLLAIGVFGLIKTLKKRNKYGD